MMGHERTGLLCPRSGTGTQAGILCSAASVVAKKTSSTEAQGPEKETHSRRLIQEEVDSLLMKGAIESVRDRNRGFYSNHKEEDVQDVHHQRRLLDYSQRRLGLHNRLQGRLPSCGHSKRSQKVPTLLMGRKELPVPSPLL